MTRVRCMGFLYSLLLLEGRGPQYQYQLDIRLLAIGPTPALVSNYSSLHFTAERVSIFLIVVSSLVDKNRCYIVC